MVRKDQPAAEVTGPDHGIEASVVERELSVTVEFGNDSAPSWPVVKVFGEVDIETSPALEEQLRSVLDQGHPSLLVDLAGVTFLDSTGLSVLIGGLRRCQDLGGELHLISPRPNVRKVLEVTGLMDTFHVEPGSEGQPD
ncbi:MAG TPA: STAS domain-containing protein [Acidimicrobiales bacterium]|jgi:anti-sigma B factor antagonist